MLMRQVGFISYFIIIIFVDIANTKIILEKKIEINTVTVY